MSEDAKSLSFPFPSQFSGTGINLIRKSAKVSEIDPDFLNPRVIVHTKIDSSKGSYYGDKIKKMFFVKKLKHSLFEIRGKNLDRKTDQKMWVPLVEDTIENNIIFSTDDDGAWYVTVLFGFVGFFKELVDKCSDMNVLDFLASKIYANYLKFMKRYVKRLLFEVFVLTSTKRIIIEPDYAAYDAGVIYAKPQMIRIPGNNFIASNGEFTDFSKKWLIAPHNAVRASKKNIRFNNETIQFTHTTSKKSKDIIYQPFISYPPYDIKQNDSKSKVNELWTVVKSNGKYEMKKHEMITSTTGKLKIKVIVNYDHVNKL